MLEWYAIREDFNKRKNLRISAKVRELGGSRTHNRLIRSQGLYPIELLVRVV